MLKNEQGFTVIEVLVVIVVAVLVGGWVYAWQHGQVEEAKKGSTATPTPTVVSTPAGSPTPTPDPYDSWKAYAQANGYYSFKYPANWTVSSRTIGGVDDVTVSKGDVSEVQFDRYIDGVGCGEEGSPTKEALVGSTAMTLTAGCGGPYSVTTWIESQPHTKDAGAAVRIVASYDKGEDTNIALLLGSVSGLIPMSSQ